ncbi:MAG: glycoside hydrolase family protein [Sphingobacteriales bacterium]|nr:glycoside hydrolase family protein [Sphingobacteriales bacterium]
MKTGKYLSQLLTGALLFACLQIQAQQTDYTIKAVPFTQVKFTDQLWTSHIETNRTVTIPASFKRCETTGRVKNFQMAAEKKDKFCTVFPFDDTDIYKTVEGASFSMAVHPDKKLDKYVDSLIEIVGKAQEPDGYLYTARTIDPLNPHAWAGKDRWVNEHDNSHETYNSGHLFEAAAAHFQATGKRNLLNIAYKNADLLVKTFGNDKLHVPPGHEVVEMGLVKLYRISGKKEYLNLAKFFLDQRGQRKYDPKSANPWENGSYWQDNAPVIAQNEAEGHAVRAMYLYSAMADVAALTGDTSYLSAIDKIWSNMTGKKMYVQGSIGSIPSGERFGGDYELPNSTAYNETCAAIGNAMWNQRMFQLHGDSKYMDVLEKTLYNGLISGVGLDGKSFFYTNAMEIKHSFSHSAMERERSGWFECSCCPTNIARFLPSLPGYVYAQSGNSVYVNLFISGSADMTVNSKAVKLVQQNNYPWDGGLLFTVNPASSLDFALKIRIPGWAQNQAIPSELYNYKTRSDSKIQIKINGTPTEYKMEKGYAVLNRNWKKNDRVEVNLPMEVKRVAATDKVVNNIGKVALQRGPLMYCAEWKDNYGLASNIIIPVGAAFTTEFNKELLNGVMTLKAPAIFINVDDAGKKISTEEKKVTIIPYYSWANRGKGEMTVWFPEKIKYVDLLSN